MKPREAEEYLYRLKRYGMKKGFDRALYLLESLGNPHEEFEAIQVGGTNGKGSVAKMIESGLRCDGEKVGLYTSPHMTFLGERIRVNGREMKRTEMADFVEEARPVIEEMIADGDPPTFFETTTVMAFYEFARRGVDYAVLEVGMGGRFDTTSVCDTDLSAITSIDLEHTQVLGDTVEDIAWEIGHVIPEDGVCSTGTEANNEEAVEVLKEMAEERDSELVIAGEDIEYTSHGCVDGYEHSVELESETEYDLRIPLLGEHQAKNAAVALGVLEEVGVSRSSIVDGLRHAYWPGRVEVVDNSPTVVLDAAHNPAATEALVSALEKEFVFDDVFFVFGVVSDKDIKGMAEQIACVAETVYTTRPPTPRAEDEETVAGIFDNFDIKTKTRKPVLRAVDKAIQDAENDDLVVVTGSLFTVGEARRGWTEEALLKQFEGVEEANSSLSRSGVRTPFEDAPEMVNRVLRLRNLSDPQLDVIRETADDTDLNTSISSHEQPEMTADLTLSGSHSEYKDFLEELDSPTVESMIRTTLDDLDTSVDIPDSIRSRTDVMGILNVTPDSFFDGGRYEAVEDAVERAHEMVDEGADIIDVGGESTRPGADPVPPEEEKERVIPVIERIYSELDVPISVDTRHPEVAREALGAGAEIINDVTGLSDPEMRLVAAENECQVIIMDSVNVPVDPSYTPVHDDVVEDVIDRISEKILKARRAGVSDEDIIIDPGIGFGKGKDGDAEILSRTEEFTSLGYPLLIGCSRKSFIEGILDIPKEERLEPSIAANVIAATKGADIVRVHDVEETVKAIEVTDALTGF